MPHTRILTLVPAGGLANRMRAIASAVTLARHHHFTLHIVWHRDSGLNCNFEQLFQSFQASDIEVRNAIFYDRFFCDRPRKGNFQLTRYTLPLRFDGILHDSICAEAFSKQTFDFNQWLPVHRHPFIATCYELCPVSSQTYRELFIPIDEIDSCVHDYTEQFSTHTVGVHIRRTDNIMSIAGSPLELFIQEMKKETEQNHDTKFFVASDSEEVKQELKKYFGTRIITSSRPADRNSIHGMQDGAVDFFTLSRTSKILGSTYSSFSEISAAFNNTPYKCIQK